MDETMIENAIETYEENTMAQSALEKIQKLDQERDKLLAEATQEALERAEEAIEDLNALGYEYALVNGNKPKKAKRQGAGQVKDGAVCSVCDFATIPPHDKRSHRGGKPAFTKQDLDERGMTRVK